jgi:hypothetical protein
MKIARVFVSEYPGRQVGDILDVFDPANRPGAVLSGVLREVEVDDDFDAFIMRASVDPDGSVSFEPDPAKVAADKSRRIEQAYKQMDADIAAEMLQVFGTTRADSATAFYETWKLMRDKPELFYNRGLKVLVPHGDFSAGDALNSYQKCTDYAEAAISAAESFSVNRMIRIKQFNQEKDAILAE